MWNPDDINIPNFLKSSDFDSLFDSVSTSIRGIADSAIWLMAFLIVINLVTKLFNHFAEVSTSGGESAKKSSILFDDNSKESSLSDGSLMDNDTENNESYRLFADNYYGKGGRKK